MGFPIRRDQRRWHGRRLAVSLFWAVLCCLGANALIEYCYGPGADFFGAHQLLAWGIAFVGLMVVPGVVIWFLVRLWGFLRWKKRLGRSMALYLREPEEDPLSLLEKDLYCRLFDTVDCWIGRDWLVVPGAAMARESVAGIFYEALGRKYLSDKIRIALIDDTGRMLYLDVGERLHPRVFQYLRDIHPEAGWGDIREYRAFLLKEEQRGEINYRHLRSPAPPAPLGISARDRSPMLEDNRLCCQYERWLLASYAVYIAGEGIHYGSFDHAGGWELSAFQRRLAVEVLAGPWDVHDREQLLETAEHLRVTGKMAHDGWQLGRAPMVLGFGYIAGYLTRRELLEYSLPVAKAIQETFRSWKELHDSYMASYERWSGKRKAIAGRRRAYRALLRDPGSVLNTVPFNLELGGRYREALAMVAGEKGW